MHRWLQAMLLLPLALTSGCATHALWTSSALDSCNEPSSKANLHLYVSRPPQDFLVVYDEFSNRYGTTNTRAYFLYQNEERMGLKHAPHYVNSKLAQGLTPVPLFQEVSQPGTNQPAKPYVVSSADHRAFTLFYGDGGSDIYQLPIYNDGTGKYERAALTPLTSSADAATWAAVGFLTSWASLGDAGYSAR